MFVPGWFTEADLDGINKNKALEITSKPTNLKILFSTILKRSRVEAEAIRCA